MATTTVSDDVFMTFITSKEVSGGMQNINHSVIIFPWNSGSCHHSISRECQIALQVSGGVVGETGAFLLHCSAEAVIAMLIHILAYVKKIDI